MAGWLGARSQHHLRGMPKGLRCDACSSHSASRGAQQRTVCIVWRRAHVCSPCTHAGQTASWTDMTKCFHGLVCRAWHLHTHLTARASVQSMCLRMDVRSRDTNPPYVTYHVPIIYQETHLATAVRCQGRAAAPTQTRSHRMVRMCPICHAWQRSPWCHASSRAPRRACTAAAGRAWQQVTCHDKAGTGRSGKAKCMAQSAQLLH